jgi:hypothetical protein
MELRLVEPGTTGKTMGKSYSNCNWIYIGDIPGDMDVIDFQPTKMLIGTGITDSLVNLDKHGCPSATSNMAEHWKSSKEKGGCNGTYRRSILVTSYNWFVSPVL